MEAVSRQVQVVADVWMADIGCRMHCFFPVNYHQLFYLYPVLIFCCNDKTLTTASGWKGLPWLAAGHQWIKVGAGTQSRNLEAGT